VTLRVFTTLIFSSLLSLLPLCAQAAEGRVLVVVGMASEARLVAGSNVTVVVGAMRSEDLRKKLEAQNLTNVTAVISFGVAGGLNPSLKVSQLVLPRKVIYGESSLESSAELTTQIAARLSGIGLTANEEPILGTDKLEAGEDQMRDTAYARTGAGSIDMETHIAIDFASRHQLPFAAIRTLSDAKGDVLPPAALLPLDENGEVQYALVASSIFWNPWQIPALQTTNAHFKLSRTGVSWKDEKPHSYAAHIVPGSPFSHCRARHFLTNIGNRHFRGRLLLGHGGIFPQAPRSGGNPRGLYGRHGAKPKIRRHPRWPYRPCRKRGDQIRSKENQL
jgi:adenosylhomocysteine nucleosidase